MNAESLMAASPTSSDEADSNSPPVAVHSASADVPQLDAEALVALPAVPRALQRSDAADGLRALAFGLLASVASSALAFVSSAEGSMLRKLFDPGRFASLIPVATSALFFFALAVLHLRRRRLRAAKHVATREVVLSVARSLGERGLEATERQLRESDLAAANPLLRRVRAVLGQWLVQPGRHEAELAQQSLIDRDAERREAAYSVLRLASWALPVFGLAGSVLGIADAVGGFSTFLAGNVDAIADVKRNLVSVTSGLSFAFLLTLQGLAGAVVVMLLSAAMQNREQRHEAEIQQWMADIVIPVVQSDFRREVPTSSRPVDELIDGFAGILQQSRVAFLHELRQVSERHLQALADERNAAVEANAEAARAWAQQFRVEVGSASRALEDGSIGAGRSLTEALAEAMCRVEGIVSTVVDRVQALEALTRSMADEQAQRQAAAQEVHAALDRALAQTLAGTRDLSESLGKTLELNRSAVDQLRQSGIGPALTELGERLAQQVEHSRSTGERLDESTRNLADCHRGVLAGIRQLSELKFDSALRDLGLTLGRIQPVLEHFQQPFVLTATPVQPRANGH